MKHGGRISGLAVTQEGTRIISSGSGRIKVWDVESHKLVKEWAHLAEKDCIVSISPDDRLVAVGGGMHMVDVYSMEGRHVVSIEVGEYLRSMCFSPDGNKLACSTSNSTRVYDVNSGVPMLGPLDGWALDVLWSRDDRLFAGLLNGTIRCWNSDTGQQIGHPWTGHTSAICSLSLSPDGTILASASWDETVRFWNATTGDSIGQHIQHVSPRRLGARSAPATVRFSPSGEFLASTGWGQGIYIWEVVGCLGQCQTSNFKYVFPVACSRMI